MEMVRTHPELAAQALLAFRDGASGTDDELAEAGAQLIAEALMTVVQLGKKG
jgi:hypothetical protein